MEKQRNPVGPDLKIWERIPSSYFFFNYDPTQRLLWSHQLRGVGMWCDWDGESVDLHPAAAFSFPQHILRKSQCWQSFKAGDRTRVRGQTSTPSLCAPNLWFMSTYREEMWPFHRNSKETKRSLVKFVSPSGQIGKKILRLSGNISLSRFVPQTRFRLLWQHEPPSSLPIPLPSVLGSADFTEGRGTIKRTS